MKLALRSDSPVLAAVAASALALATAIATVVTLAMGIVLVAALFSDEAHAQVAVTTVAPTAPAASPLYAVMQGLVGLVIVVGVIYIAAWFVKKIGPRTRASGMVHVVGGASVGPREKVVVVRFGTQTLLLGVAQGHVSLLHTADGDAMGDEIVAPASGTTPTFVDRLRAARGGA